MWSRGEVCALLGVVGDLEAREVRLRPEVLCRLPALLPLELEAGLAVEFHYVESVENGSSADYLTWRRE